MNPNPATDGDMDIRYIAGLFDGEGSVGIYRTSNNKRRAAGGAAPSARKTYWSVSLCIAGTYRPMIEALVKHMPGATLVGDQRSVARRTPTKVYAQGHCRPSFKAQMGRRDQVGLFLRRLRPYLWEKAKQADIVLRWIDGDLDGSTASRMCKRAKRFKFRNMDRISAKSRKQPPSGSEAHMAKLTGVQVRDIRRRFAAGESQNELAVAYGTNRTMIFKVVHGETYKHEGGVLLHGRVRMRRLSESQIRSVRQRVAKGAQQAALAREFGVGTSTINRIVLRRGCYATAR